MITRLLIIVNVLAFLFEFVTLGGGILTGNVDSAGIVRDGAIVPANVMQYHEYWRLVTGAFLHASVFHIAVNMFSLWVLGNFIEAALGPWRMAVVYGFSMIVSSLGVVYFSGPANLMTPTLGASGAIFGLFGALFAIGFKFGPRGMQLVKQNLGVLAINLVITFAIPGISKAAHVAGLLAGFALTYLIYFPPRRLRAQVLDARTGREMESELEMPYSGSGLK